MNSSSIRRRPGAVAGLLAAALALAGCYELQAVRGHARLLWQRVPIARVTADPATPPAIRAQLQAAASMRDFASRELALPDNGSYRSYADIHRAFVVWNVFAAPEFSVAAKLWCYPVAGCVAYRGYFSEREARGYAARLQRRGFDVAVRGAAAYSTLGRFDDPLLSSMVGWRDVDLAAIIFHELTHQLLYVKGDTAFNEALATLIEEEGVRRWLRAQGREPDLGDFETRQEHYRQFAALVAAARGRLRDLYATALPAAEMRGRKRAIFEQLRGDYRLLQPRWGGDAGYDAWFRADLNNAELVPVAAYSSCVPGLRRELELVAGELPRFYARARELAALPRARRDALVCGAVAP